MLTATSSCQHLGPSQHPAAALQTPAAGAMLMLMEMMISHDKKLKNQEEQGELLIRALRIRGIWPGLWIRIHFLRIRIQLFPQCESGSRCGSGS